MLYLVSSVPYVVWAPCTRLYKIVSGVQFAYVYMYIMFGLPCPIRRKIRAFAKFSALGGGGGVA